MANNFGLTIGSTPQQIISSLNYALVNMNAGSTTGTDVVTANTTTGIVGTVSSNSTTTTTTITGYLYQYMDVAYATSSTGANFSFSPTNATYYGLHNTNSTTVSTNPPDYQWYQVTGGFGVTKQLYYATIGGRQAIFVPGTQPPNPSYLVAPTDTPINLDLVSGQGNQLINVNTYYQGNTAPATPTGGYYNFANLTLTPPVGWTSSIPPFVANTVIYISSDVFEGNSFSNVGPALPWTSPVVYSQQFNGNTGAQGQRGFVPLGFVVTSSDPTNYTDAQYTTAFSASRANPSAPIGLGYTPITGDTAQFFYANLFNSNYDVTITKSFNSNTTPQWTSVTSQVVSGNLIYPGTITINQLNVNEVYTIDIQSTNASIGNVQSPGYWLQANTGSASFAGTLTVGNNLTVGNTANIGNYLTIGAGAVIGSNLIVGDSAGIGNNLIVGVDALIGNNATIEANATVGNNLTVGTNASIGNNLNIANNATIGNNLTVGTGANIGGVIIAGTLAAGTVGNLQLQANINGGVIAANSIVGSSIVAGSITATQLQANLLVVGNITSTGQTIEHPTGTGYWLDYTNGNVYFGGNTTIGNSLKVGANASIGNNLTVGTNATIGGVIIGGVIATGQVGNVQLQSNINGGLLANGTIANTAIISVDGSQINASSITATQIGSNAITTAKIAAGAVTASQIAAQTITASQIAAGAITATQIASGTITASQIAADTITASQIASQTITAGQIASGTITAGQIASQTITAGQIAAGTITAVQIAAQTITGTQIAANTITGNNINANTVTTTNLVFNSATGSASKGPDLPGNYTVAFYNNGITNPLQSGYVWPQNTRGFAIEGGLSYIPTFSGNTQTNTRLVVVYSGYIFGANAANVVEIWKSGGSTYYAQTYETIQCLQPVTGTTTSDHIWLGGQNTYWGYNQNPSLAGGWNISADVSDASQTIFQSAVGYRETSTTNFVYVGGVATANGGAMYESYGNPPAAPSTPIYNIINTTTYGLITIFETATTGWIIGCGSNGTIYHYLDNQELSGPTQETTGTYQALYGLCLDRGIQNTGSSPAVVVVGSNGTILYNTYGYSGNSLIPGTWTQKNSGTLNNLNSVYSNWQAGGYTGVATQWVAVGNYGTILYSSDGQNWHTATSPTSQNLYGVTYGNGMWVAVGAQGTTVWSTNGTTWTLAQAPMGNDDKYRDLNSVCYGTNSQLFLAAGQSIIQQAYNNSGSLSSWATQVDNGPSVATQFTNVLSLGTVSANVANVTIPPAAQQLGTQIVSGSFTDYNYTAGTTVTYYLVMGNLTENTANIVYTNSPTLQITEFKR
jgi:UDP-3-O-[3-hydroxymyristoyl] glucosamine N-acyltransferase